MTATKTYYCDLCPRMITGDRDGIGIYWAPGDNLEERSIIAVEHHLCRKCIGALRAFLPKVKE